MMIISSFLSFCYEKTTKAQYIERSRRAYELSLFQAFRLGFASDFSNLLLVRFHQAGITRDNYREAPYVRTQQRGLGGS